MIFYCNKNKRNVNVKLQRRKKYKYINYYNINNNLRFIFNVKYKILALANRLFVSVLIYLINKFGQLLSNIKLDDSCLCTQQGKLKIII